MKNNICIIIGAYPTTFLDSSLLGLTIESWRQQGYDICLASHSPVNPDIQRAVKYYIYSDENEMLDFPTQSSVAIYHANSTFLYQTNFGNTLGKHSYAVLQNIKNSVHFLSSKDYTHFFYIEADGFLNLEDHLKFQEELEQSNFINHDYWFMMEYSELATLPVSNFFGGRIEFFLDRFNLIKDHQSYFDFASTGGGYSLESLFGELFVKQPIGEGTVKNTNPRNFFTNEWFGVSNGGEVGVPGLKTKDWWIDLVRDRHDDTVFYPMVYHTQHTFDTVLKLFKNNEEVFSTPFQTGPLVWFRSDIEPNCIWRFEQWIGNEKIKQIEYTSQQIIENVWSFMEFH